MNQAAAKKDRLSDRQRPRTWDNVQLFSMWGISDGWIRRSSFDSNMLLFRGLNGKTLSKT